MASEECSRITTELDEEFKRLIFPVFPVFPDTSSGCTVSVLPWAPTRDIAMGGSSGVRVLLLVVRVWSVRSACGVGGRGWRVREMAMSQRIIYVSGQPP